MWVIEHRTVWAIGPRKNTYLSHVCPCFLEDINNYLVNLPVFKLKSSLYFGGSFKTCTPLNGDLAMMSDSVACCCE